MIQDPIVEDAKRKLDELEQKIHTARSLREIAGQAHEDWQPMVRTHTGISRKLEAAKDNPAEVLVGIRFDIDILGHSFEKWMARVKEASHKTASEKKVPRSSRGDRGETSPQENHCSSSKLEQISVNSL